MLKKEKKENLDLGLTLKSHGLPPHHHHSTLSYKHEGKKVSECQVQELHKIKYVKKRIFYWVCHKISTVLLQGLTYLFLPNWFSLV